MSASTSHSAGPNERRWSPPAQIFVKENGPVKFFLLTERDFLVPENISVLQRPLSAQHAQELSRHIRRHGGRLLPQRDEADTLIVNEEAREAYAQHYKFHKTIHIEPPGFVSRCIKLGRYHHDPPRRMGMGGREPKLKRTKFNEEDERNMCRWLAKVLPDPLDGGRLGYGVWNALMEATEPEYSWNRRHTTQSWLEHYKKNRDRLDALVAEIVAEAPPNPKFLYHLSRQHTRRRQGYSRVREEEMFDEDLYDDLEQVESMVLPVSGTSEGPNDTVPAERHSASLEPAAQPSLPNEREDGGSGGDEVPVPQFEAQEEEEEEGGWLSPSDWEKAPDEDHSTPVRTVQGGEGRPDDARSSPPLFLEDDDLPQPISAVAGALPVSPVQALGMSSQMTLVDSGASRLIFDQQVARLEVRGTRTTKRAHPSSAPSSPEDAAHRQRRSGSKSRAAKRKKMQPEVLVDPVHHASPASRSATQQKRPPPAESGDDEEGHLSSDDEQIRRRLAGGERSPAPSPDTGRAGTNLLSPTRSSHHAFSASDADEEEEEEEEEDRVENFPRTSRRSERPTDSRPTLSANLSTVVQAVQAQVLGTRGAARAAVEVDAVPNPRVRRSSRLGGKGNPRT